MAAAARDRGIMPGHRVSATDGRSGTVATVSPTGIVVQWGGASAPSVSAPCDLACLALVDIAEEANSNTAAVFRTIEETTQFSKLTHATTQQRFQAPQEEPAV